MEGRRFVKGLLSKAESLLSKIVSSLWDGAESDSIPKAKPFHCCWRVPSAYGNEPIPYQLTFSDGGRSRDPLPSFETHDHLCPLPALACRGIYFFRRGTEVMPWLVHTRKIRALSSLSASKGGGLWNLGSWFQSAQATSLLHVHTPSHAGKLLPQAARGGFSG